MKALAILAFVLLVVVAHPVAVALVLGTEMALCAALGWLIWRAVPLGFYRLGRTA